MTTPPRYWRSPSELRLPVHPATPEFPPDADRPPDGFSRRDFVKLLGASAALAGLQACERPAGRIIPYVHRPAEVVPGLPLDYATTMTLDGYGFGLVARSREGRPIKVEGNPDHPASLGACGVFEQASILQLYDPHRGRMIREGDRPRSWGHFLRRVGPGGEGPQPPDAGARPFVPPGGRGLHFLLEPTASSFRVAWIRAIRQRFPEARFHFHAPAASTADLEGARRAFNRRLLPLYDFRAAEVVVALDANVLDEGPFRIRYARDFAAARTLDRPEATMNRLYAAEPLLSPTSAIADHHLPVRGSAIPRVAAALAGAVGAADATPEADAPPAGFERLSDDEAAWVRFAARDLRDHRGRGAVVVGPGQPPEVHALAWGLNAALGNVGGAVRAVEPALFEAGGPSHGLEPLVAAMSAGDVTTLVVLDSNPVYTASADLPFRDALARVRHTVCLGTHENETAERCQWYIPAAHYLETWGDARAYDGTLSTVQPLIAPLHGARSVDEVLAAFAGRGGTPVRDQLREHWRAAIAPAYGGDRAFDAFWQTTLKRGVVPDSASERLAPALAAGVGALTEAVRGRARALERAVTVADAAAGASRAGPSTADQAGVGERAGREPAGDAGERASPELERPAGYLEVGIGPDPRVHDGRFANNAWLLELPDPVTKLTWENAALVAPATADRLGVRTGDVVRLSYAGHTLEVPVMAVPGHAPDAATLRLGYGRQGAEETALGAGVSAYRLRTSDRPALLPRVAVTRLFEEHGAEHRLRPRRVKLASTQTHWSMEGREIVLEHTLEGYRREPEFTHRHKGPVATLYDGPGLEGEQQWAMTIDLSICTGCSACVVACQAENNIPVVGKEGVEASREMHWIRVDRYLTGPPDRPHVVHQPMLCQHCEKAPCEYVCPVNATVHSGDGLNEMIYNRCVGTRFCSNNCAWKVRRFNWFDYNNDREPPETLVLNPDVTVRERGVMEKCTYCVQRIRRAEREAEVDGRSLRRDEVTTACQQACPTHAIVFGSLTDPESEVSKTREQPRIYSVLHELGTKPRTQYLARIGNPDPALHDERRRIERAREERPL